MSWEMNLGVFVGGIRWRELGVGGGGSGLGREGLFWYWRGEIHGMEQKDLVEHGSL